MDPFPEIIKHFDPSRSRKNDPRVKGLFDDLDKLRAEFESIERPTLEIETPTPRGPESPSGSKPQRSLSHPTVQVTETKKAETYEHPKSPAVKSEQVLDPEAELAKLESEFGSVSRDYSAEEIGDWEFDELERELRSDDTAPNK